MSVGADLAIEVEGLRKRYRDHEALRGVDLAVPAGSLLGLLGPNGAGKTTTVRILATLLSPDAGTARVAGFDVVREPREIRRRIGLAGQYAAVDEQLTGRENLVLLGRLLHLGRRLARQRADGLLEQFDLVDAADRPLRTYSGGMRRRLDLASCLVGEPEVLFLDEPTTGLDPASRLTLWATVQALLATGVTVLLTTQYLEEADALADRIAVVADGVIIAEGTAEELKGRMRARRLELTVGDASDLSAARAALSRLAGELEVDERRRVISVRADDGLADVSAVADQLRRHGIDVSEMAMRQPTLDEVFLHLTEQGSDQAGDRHAASLSGSGATE